MNEAQHVRVAQGVGFIAALDQSGGSTPQALRQYGVRDSDYADDDRMFDLMHEFRSRIITSAAFDGDRILAAILFEQTMQRHIDEQPDGEKCGDQDGPAGDDLGSPVADQAPEEPGDECREQRQKNGCNFHDRRLSPSSC